MHPCVLGEKPLNPLAKSRGAFTAIPIMQGGSKSTNTVAILEALHASHWERSGADKVEMN